MKPLFINIIRIERDIIVLKVFHNLKRKHKLTFKCNYKYVAWMLRQTLPYPERKVIVTDTLTMESWMYFQGERKFITQEYKRGLYAIM